MEPKHRLVISILDTSERKSIQSRTRMHQFIFLTLVKIFQSDERAENSLFDYEKHNDSLIYCRGLNDVVAELNSSGIISFTKEETYDGHVKNVYKLTPKGRAVADDISEYDSPVERMLSEHEFKSLDKLTEDALYEYYSLETVR